MTTTESTAPTLAAPTARSLLLTMGVALAVATIALLFFVLPAEYGIDPTGVGSRLGLTQMASAPMGTVPMADASLGTVVYYDEPPKKETVVLEIGPREEIEYKLGMVAGNTVFFSWNTDQGTLYSDFHGDPYNDLDGTEVRYGERFDVDSGLGALKAPYNGYHGWYWRNDNDFPLQVTLDVEGYYTHMQELHRAPAQASGHPLDGQPKPPEG